MVKITQYVHYGSDTFEPARVTESVYCYPGKPPYGLWGCRQGGKYDWRSFCLGKRMLEAQLLTQFTFHLTPEARVLEIFRPDDVEAYMTQEWTETCRSRQLDFPRLKAAYDGMELMDFRAWQRNPFLHFLLPGWDCESICVWNPEVIVAE